MTMLLQLGTEVVAVVKECLAEEMSLVGSDGPESGECGIGLHWIDGIGKHVGS